MNEQEQMLEFFMSSLIEDLAKNYKHLSREEEINSDLKIEKEDIQI